MTEDESHMNDICGKKRVSAGRGRVEDAQLADLVHSFFPLVVRIARRVLRTLPSHIELDDLVSAGVIGLMDAVEKYEVTRPTSFQSYASIRIQGAIYDELRSCDFVSRSLREQRKHIERVRGDLERALGRAASVAEVAQALGLSLDEYHSLAHLTHFVNLSLNGRYGSDDCTEWELEDRNLKPIGQKLENAELGKLIHQYVDSLPDREATVVRLSFFEELNLAEIARLLGVTESRVSQIRSTAFARIRKKHESVAG